jgi:hypothetical protein
MKSRGLIRPGLLVTRKLESRGWCVVQGILVDADSSSQAIPSQRGKRKCVSVIREGLTSMKSWNEMDQAEKTEFLEQWCNNMTNGLRRMESQIRAVHDRITAVETKMKGETA